MGRRSPYLTKSKAAKNRRNNKDDSGLTDNSSQDIFYTTESNEPRARYEYTNKYKNYKDYFTSDIYNSRLFDKYSPKRKGSGESYTYEDYTTSGISYSERKKRPVNQIYSVSTSEYISKPPEKYLNISSLRDYDHSYLYGSRTREKKRPRLARDLDKTNYHDTDILDESEQYLDRSRKYRSPRSRYYKDLIHEEPEKEFDYGIYFEKAGTKVGSSPKQRRLDKDNDERDEKQNKLLSRAPNKRNDYQVYAYQDPKHHEEVFKSQNHPGDLSFSSEVEIKTHEYPVLAFKDPKSGKNESDMVYLPIIVLDKKLGKSRSEKRPEEPIFQSNTDNFQVYAANLQEQTNIFKNFGDLPNITFKEPTSNERDFSSKQDFGIAKKSGMRYAGSLLGTIIDEAVDTDFGNDDFPNEIKAGQSIPFTTGKSPFTYQVDVDISPNEPKGSLKDKDKKSSHIKNSSINDPLHDGYPVTKDYIKVSASEQNRKSTLSPLRSKDENMQSSDIGHKVSGEKNSNIKKEQALTPPSIKLSSDIGHKVSGEKNSNTKKEQALTPPSIRLIDDQTISKSIAQSKTIPTGRSIMKNPSQEQLLNKQLSPTRESVAIGTKRTSRPSHTRPADKSDTKSMQTATKLSVLNEDPSQDLKRKSIRTVIPQHQSNGRSSNPTTPSSGLAENTVGAGTRHQSYGSDRISMKSDMKKEQNVGRRSEVHTSPSPGVDHRKSVLHSPVGQDRKSTVAHMSSTPTPSSHNVSESHAQSRRSAVEDRKRKVPTPPLTQQTFPVSDHRKSVSPSQNIRASHAQSRKGAIEDRKSKEQTPSMQPFSVSDHRKSESPSSQNIRTSHAQSRKSAVEDRKSKVQTSPATQPFLVSDNRKSVSPSSQNIRSSHTQSRKSAVAPRTSTANFNKDDGRKSMQPSTPEQLQETVPGSGKKSLAQNVLHHNSHIVAGNTNKLSHKVEKEDDSEEALRQFTKDVFAVDLESQRKSQSHKSERNKPSILKEKFISDVRPNQEVENKRQSGKSAVGQQPLYANRQSQNVQGNFEPSHELIGDNSAGIGKALTVQEEKRKPGSLMRTTSKVFATLSKIGKKKSTEQANPATVTQENKDSHFIRSIEPTVTQYKKEQNKTHTLTKSKSKPDNKAPKEKRSLTRLFSRSKSKLNNKSGDDTKKKKKHKSRSLLGILKRSKSSELMAAPPSEGEDPLAVSCECFAHYEQNTRVCVYFFLGTTLHEQIMNIIKIFLGQN